VLSLSNAATSSSDEIQSGASITGLSV
jgi:hypothetical protein